MIWTRLASTHDLFINELVVLGSQVISDFATSNIIFLTPSCILQENEIILWTTGFMEMQLHIAHGLSFFLQILHYDQYSSFSMPKVQSTIVAKNRQLELDVKKALAHHIQTQEMHRHEQIEACIFNLLHVIFQTT